ncbi:4-coumarate--CoA ligase 1 isoform X2 [Nematostella vectensis]|uniref:4-coumarate--CoA ligase 1 isoform X2 n=1 Tax=Nematostella vectensis TaxID=45351 RepID=UPI0020773483|nr:4-coumarate--CoA ligase 1 isoform X2 [Nematostella vectensis]
MASLALSSRASHLLCRSIRLSSSRLSTAIKLARPCTTIRWYTVSSDDRILRSSYPAIDVPKNQSYVQFILDCCKRNGDKEALVDGPTGETYTYTDLITLIKKCGSALLQAGVKPKDVALLHLPNIMQYPVYLYGAQAIGAVVTTANPGYTVDELAYQLIDSSAKYIITDSKLYHTAIEAARKANVEHVFESVEFFKDLLKDDGSKLKGVYSPTDPTEAICMPYSSGTTGVSKGVLQSHYNYIGHALSLGSKEFMQWDKRLVTLSLLPLFHAFGLAVNVGMHFYLGSKVILLQGFEPEQLLKTIEKYKVNDFPMVPPLALFLAKHPLVDKYDLSSLESMISAAAPVGKGILRTMAERIPSLKIVRQGYGLTEATAGAIVNPIDPTKCKDGSVGVLLPNLEGKVTDLDTGEALGPNQEGEICLRGPIVTHGYLNKPEQTANTFTSDGWLHTGDIGYYDTEDYFYITDRLKELIKYKGHQVPPAELEALLVSHPHIADAAVIGIPDDVAGELPRAFVVVKAEISEREILDFVTEHVAPEKKLRGGVEFVEAIPKTPTGKILRRVLKKEALAS